jgi:hypothetical protein
MKVLFVLSCSVLLIYLLLLPWQQARALNRARAALADHHFEQAMREVDWVRHVWPQFSADQTTTLCGDVTLAQARQFLAGPQPDFSGAVSLAHTLASRCQTTDRHGEVGRLVEHAATQHLAQATTRCQQHDYAGALSEFQLVATLPYPDRSQTRAQEEAAQCRLTLARTLAQQHQFEAALDQLQRLSSTERGLVRTAALQQVPSVVEAAVQRWLQQQRYPQAFTQLAQYQHQFAAEPVTASVLADLGSQVEYQVFGTLLSRPCHDSVPLQRPPVQMGRQQRGKKATPPALPHPSGPVRFATALGTSATNNEQTANLLLHNTTSHRLQVLLRGPQSQDVRLEPQATLALDLEPAEYLVGVYAPGNCQVRPARSTWTIRAWAALSVRFAQD